MRGTEDERWAAARAMPDLPGGAQSGAQTAVQTAVQTLGNALLGERSARVREAIFTALARIANAESVECVLPLLRSDDAHRRTGALDALRAMPRAVHPFLPRLLADADADVRLLACELVRSVPGGEAARLLCALLESESEPNVCASAVEVLAEVGGPEALPVLARCEERFGATPFLAFSIKVAADRIRASSHQTRA
jgi:HEAT repeat protein